MSMNVGQVMSRPVLATTPRASVRDIAAQLVRGGISGMPVTDRDGKIVGIVTEYDIVNALIEGKTLENLSAQDIMASDTVALDVSAEIDDALKIFKERHVLRVPVTENGKLVGILARTDALRGLLDEPEFLIF
ncbi:MAG: CBS domain-containing protein [Leptolyngbyaceae cyanobacterium MO_188.B28]|nr:CBS domain-containing protein [Leptolyngbyaceae cyanobacterium MO_188.B28]